MSGAHAGNGLDKTRTDALVPQPETGKRSCVRHPRCGRLSPGACEDNAERRGKFGGSCGSKAGSFCQHRFRGGSRGPAQRSTHLDKEVYQRRRCPRHCERNEAIPAERTALQSSSPVRPGDPVVMSITTSNRSLINRVIALRSKAKRENFADY